MGDTLDDDVGVIRREDVAGSEKPGAGPGLTRLEEDPQALAHRGDAARRDGTPLKVASAAGAIWINPQALVTISPHDLAASQLRSRQFSDEG